MATCPNGHTQADSAAFCSACGLQISPSSVTNQPDAVLGADLPSQRSVTVAILVGVVVLLLFAGCQSGGGTQGGGGRSAAYARGYRDGGDYEQLGYSQGVCASAPDILRSDSEKSDWRNGCYAGWAASYNR